MKIKYISCDESTVEEKIDSVIFHEITSTKGVELTCKRSKDNPYYKANDGFNGCFYVEAEKVIKIAE